MHIPLGRGLAAGVGEHRRDREAGLLVYPVISRRSGGLSLGINLFPSAKVCTFDCPYCEIFLPDEASSGPDEATSGPDDASPGKGGGDFSIAALEGQLENFLGQAYPESWAPEPLRDLCISGNGEPTASPHLEEALELCAGVRRSRPELLGSSSLVIITNSTGFRDAGTSALLERFARDEDLVIWAKLDAGSEGLFRSMSGLRGAEAGGLELLAGGLLSFASHTRIVIQTMFCEVKGRSPTDGEVADYAALLSRLIKGGARIGEVHMYTLARPSLAGTCSALPDETLRTHARLVRERTGLPVRVFGTRAEL